MFLLVKEGSEVGRVYKLREGNMIAGRNPSSHISLVNDFSVSREHVRITCKPDGSCTVTDLNATNGSYLNGRRLLPDVPVALEPGATLRIGKTLFEVILNPVSSGRVPRIQKQLPSNPPDLEEMSRRAGHTDRAQSIRAADLATDFLNKNDHPEVKPEK